jgi:hypothetical protein
MYKAENSSLVALYNMAILTRALSLPLWFKIGHTVAWLCSSLHRPSLRRLCYMCHLHYKTLLCFLLATLLWYGNRNVKGKFRLCYAYVKLLFLNHETNSFGYEINHFHWLYNLSPQDWMRRPLCENVVINNTHITPSEILNPEAEDDTGILGCRIYSTVHHDNNQNLLLHAIQIAWCWAPCHKINLLSHVWMLNYLFERKCLDPLHGVDIKDIHCILTVHWEVRRTVTWERGDTAEFGSYWTQAFGVPAEQVSHQEPTVITLDHIRTVLK